MSSPRLLAALAFLGLALAVGGALHFEAEAPPAPVPDDGLVRVGERILTVGDLRRAVEEQAGLRRGEVEPAELRRLLDSLVDEELLVQRAEALGLVDTDPTLRRALQTAKKERSAATAPMPSEEELRALYAAGEYGGLDFEQVRPRLLREHQRGAREETLQGTLEDLRAGARITYGDSP